VSNNTCSQLTQDATSEVRLLWSPGHQLFDCDRADFRCLPDIGSLVFQHTRKSTTYPPDNHLPCPNHSPRLQWRLVELA
jgi:hypothetical protein